MNSKSLSLLLFVSVCLIWGTTWFAMEVALHSIPPIFATALRFFLAAPLLIILAKSFGQPLMFPKGRRQWVIIVAIMYFAIPFTLMIYGEQYISSGLASIIFANMPVAVMAVSSLFLGLRLSKHQLFGLVVAVTSLCLILSNEMNVGGSDYLIGTASLALAVAFHALMYVLGGFTPKRGIPTVESAPQLQSPTTVPLRPSGLHKKETSEDLQIT